MAKPAAEQAAPRFSLMAPLHFPGFRLLLAGRAVTFLGEFFGAVAYPLLILEITGKASGLGTILMIGALPRTLLMFVSGVVIDALRPRTVLIVSGLVFGLANMLLAAGVLSGRLAVWQLMAIAVVFGMMQAFYLPSLDTITPEVVPDEQLRSANALTNMAFNAARFVVPLLAGVLVAAKGTAPAFALSGAGFLAFAWCIWAIRQPVLSRTPVQSPLSGFMEGVRHARQDGFTWTVILSAFAMAAGFAITFAIGLPALAKLEFGDGSRALGIMIGAAGAGSLLGASAVGALARVPRQGVVVFGAIALVGLCFALTGLMPDVWGAAVTMFFSGLFHAAAGITIFTLLQMRSAPEVRGRILALFFLAVFGLEPLWLGTGGLIGDLFGARTIMLVGGSFTLLGGLWGLTRRAIWEVP
jgi:predicted MFS family arabinose efflux permease